MKDLATDPMPAGAWPAGLEVERLLGRGPHGATVLARGRGGDPLVLKRIPGVAGTGAVGAMLRIRDLMGGLDGFVLPGACVEVGTALVTVSGPAGAVDGRHPGAAPAISLAAAASLARSLAALHDRGLHHGSLRPGNVVLDADGRPRLTDTGVAAIWAGRWDGWGGELSSYGRVAAASDVRDLARLLLACMPRDEEAGVSRSLAVVAHASTRRLASGGARILIPVLDGGGSPSARPGGRRQYPLVAAAVGVLAGVGAGGLARAPWRSPLAPPSGHLCRASAGAVHGPALEARISPGACPSTLVLSGPEIRIVGPDGRRLRFSLGSPGDIALAGDWFCRGAVLPAAYRPASGTVFEFGAWPAKDVPAVSIRAIETGVVDGSPRVVHRRGCDEVVVAPGAVGPVRGAGDQSHTAAMAPTDT